MTTLFQLGLTPEIVRKYGTVVAPPVTALMPAKYRAGQAAKRAANRAAGLTGEGKPRRRQAHPELAGLPWPVYRKEIKRLWLAK